MGDPVVLKDEDVGRIGEYVKPWLREVVDRVIPRAELGGVGSQLLERMVRVEEELKAQRVLMDERFGFMERRFEAADKRFEEFADHMERRFEAVDKRFEAMDKRFEAVDKRFEDLIGAMNTRFEDLTGAMDKRFEDLIGATNTRFEDLIGAMDRRFESVENRFNLLTWMIGVGFVVITSLTTVFGLLA